MPTPPHLGIPKRTRTRRDPRTLEWNSVQKVIFALSNITQELSPPSIADGDPVEVGRQIALYLNRLKLRKLDDQSLELVILTRIYSFGLAQCFRARGYRTNGSQSRIHVHRQAIVDVGYDRFDSIGSFANHLSAAPFDEITPSRIERWIKYGNIWCADVEVLDTANCSMPLGFMCLPASTDQWVKLVKCERQKILEKLRQNSIQQCTMNLLTAVVNNLWHWEFVPTTGIVYRMQQVDSKKLHSRTPAPYLIDWKNQSLAVVQNHNLLGCQRLSNDATFLAILMSFMPSETPLGFLQTGADARKRWSQEGNVIKLKASEFLVHPDIEGLLRDHPRLKHAWHCCQLAALGSESSLSEVLLALHEELSSDLKLFWSFQAMILTCGAIPWKSLTPILVDYSALTQCLLHTVDGFTGEVTQIPDAIRVEIAASLIEASRFAKLQQREFAIAKAYEMAPGQKDYSLYLRIAQADCQLKRLRGKLNAAEQVLVETQQLDRSKLASTAASRSACGQILNQQCLNRLQDDKTAEAIQSLESWQPRPTPMEAAVKFHNRLLWARTLRYEGLWDDAHYRLDEMECLEADNSALDYEEYYPEYVYERAALLIEQDHPDQAEVHIRKQLERMESKHITHPSNVSLRLLLAESLFAQKEKLEQAIAECEALTIICRKKFDRLHWNIIVAKINHTKLLQATRIDPPTQKELFQTAFYYWREASKLLMELQLNDGHSTLVLYLSLDNLLSSSEDPEFQEFKEATRWTLDRTQFGISEKSVKNWIPGFCGAWKKKMEGTRPLIDQMSKL